MNKADGMMMPGMEGMDGMDGGGKGEDASAKNPFEVLDKMRAGQSLLEQIHAREVRSQKDDDKQAQALMDSDPQQHIEAMRMKQEHRLQFLELPRKLLRHEAQVYTDIQRAQLANKTKPMTEPGLMMGEMMVGMHWTHILLLALGLPVLTLCAADQTREAVAALKEKAALAVTKFTIGESQRTAEELRAAVTVLERKAATGSNTEYIVTLELDRKAIEAALANPGSPDALRRLHAARADIVRKAEHAQKTSGAGTTLAATVSVSVKTVRARQVVDGYLVRANPMTAANEKPPRFGFNNPTSPSKRGMPPGEFSMWIEMDGKEMQRRPVSVGGDGEPKQEIVFEVP